MTKHKETKKRPKGSDPSGSRGDTKKRSGHIIKVLLTESGFGLTRNYLALGYGAGVSLLSFRKQHGKCFPARPLRSLDSQSGRNTAVL